MGLHVNQMHHGECTWAHDIEISLPRCEAVQWVLTAGIIEAIGHMKSMCRPWAGELQVRLLAEIATDSLQGPGLTTVFHVEATIK